MHATITPLVAHPGTSELLFITLAGVFEAYLGGVHLFIDVAEEVAYIETAPSFEAEALCEAERVARGLGFEPMEGAEADEELPDGGMRHWLAQMWFPGDEQGSKGKEMVA